MRNAVFARDPVAQAAGQSLVRAGGNAVDAVLATVLAGAVRSSPASLFGACGILVAGTGVGAHFIDGRARAPGLGGRRPRMPNPVPPVWTAAVPGLLEGVLAAHTRFGSIPFAHLVHAVTTALREGEADDGAYERSKLLQHLARLGIPALERLGLLRAMLRVAGPLGGGVFTKSDLRPVPASVIARPTCLEAGHEVLLPPRRAGRYSGRVPEPLPPIPVESAVAADMHGVVAVASWVVCPSAVVLPEWPAFALPALLPQPKKGVARWRPGEALPVPLPVAILLHEHRAWAGLGISGTGEVIHARDAAVTERLATVGVSIALGDEAPTRGAACDAVALWVVRGCDGDTVHGTLLDAAPMRCVQDTVDEPAA